MLRVAEFMIKVWKYHNEEIPEKLYLHPIYSVLCGVVDEKQKKISMWIWKFHVFIMFLCVESFFRVIFSRLSMLGNLKIAFLLQHTVSDWCIFTDALEALVAGLDDFAKFVRFRIEDAAFVLAYRVVLLEILGN